MYTTTFAAAVLAVVAASSDVNTASIGKFSLKNAAFPNIEQFEGSEEFLLVSSFGALSAGAVYVVPDIKSGVANNNVKNLESVKLNTPDFEWPNVVRTIP